MRSFSQSWEMKCNRCGLCCHEKIILGDTVLYDLDSHCEHYDPKSHSCTIYVERLRQYARCRRVSLFTAMFASYLPESCAYVQWARSKHIRFAQRRHMRFVRGERGSSDDDPLSLKTSQV